MVFKQKYIKTSNNIIIVFPELLQHEQFKDWNPVSAGFISITSVKTIDLTYGMGSETTCICYGESVSLKLKANEEVDTRLAKRQILGHLPE